MSQSLGADRRINQLVELAQNRSLTRGLVRGPYEASEILETNQFWQITLTDSRDGKLYQLRTVKKGETKDWAQQRLLTEARGLELLGKRTAREKSHFPILAGHSTQEPYWLLRQYIDGRTLLGSVDAKIKGVSYHDYRVEGYLFGPLLEQIPPATMYQAVRSYQLKLEPHWNQVFWQKKAVSDYWFHTQQKRPVLRKLFSDKELKLVDALKKYQTAIDADNFHLVHNDLKPSNVLITKPQGIVFLDWELLVLANPLYDLAQVSLQAVNFPAWRDEFDQLVLKGQSRSSRTRLVFDLFTLYLCLYFIHELLTRELPERFQEEIDLYYREYQER